jgi:hypothetical protein
MVALLMIAVLLFAVPAGAQNNPPEPRGIMPIPGYIYPTPQHRLETLRRDLARLQAMYSDRYPEVIRLKSEIAALECEIAENSATKRPSPEPPPLRIIPPEDQPIIISPVLSGRL